jgi:hypothetical protein
MVRLPKKRFLLGGGRIDEHDEEGFSQEGSSKVFAVHLEIGRFSLSEGEPSILEQLAMNDQGGKVKKSDRDCWLLDVIEVFSEDQLMDEELELEKVLARFSKRLGIGL